MSASCIQYIYGIYIRYKFTYLSSKLHYCAEINPSSSSSSPRHLITNSSPATTRVATTTTAFRANTQPHPYPHPGAPKACRPPPLHVEGWSHARPQPPRALATTGPPPRLAEAGAGPGAVEEGCQPVQALSVLIDTSLLSFSFSLAFSF